MGSIRIFRAAVEGFLPVIEADLDREDPCHARSWRYLKEHAELCLAMAPAAEALARGDTDGARGAALRMADVARRLESRIHPVFGVALSIRTIGGALGLTAKEMAG